jgi:hypothetical protein
MKDLFIYLEETFLSGARFICDVLAFSRLFISPRAILLLTCRLVD